MFQFAPLSHIPRATASKFAAHHEDDGFTGMDWVHNALRRADNP